MNGKWKNYGLWVSIASLLYMVLNDLGLQIDLTKWQTYVTAILGILCTLGIISNPEKGKWFKDSVKQQIEETQKDIQSPPRNQIGDRMPNEYK